VQTIKGLRTKQIFAWLENLPDILMCCVSSSLKAVLSVLPHIAQTAHSLSFADGLNQYHSLRFLKLLIQFSIIFC